MLREYQLDESALALKSENGPLALRRLRPLALLGDKTAEALMANIYAYGLGGARKSDQDAIYWFHRCGTIRGVPADYKTDPAAPAELSVAKTYAFGEQGVKIDSVESVKWLKLAAKGGNKEASAMLARSSSR